MAACIHAPTLLAFDLHGSLDGYVVTYGRACPQGDDVVWEAKTFDEAAAGQRLAREALALLTQTLARKEA